MKFSIYLNRCVFVMQRNEQEPFQHWVDVQADPSLCLSHRSNCRFVVRCLLSVNRELGMLSLVLFTLIPQMDSSIIELTHLYQVDSSAITIWSGLFPKRVSLAIFYDNCVIQKFLGVMQTV